jgi:hypothetical protein
MPCPRLPYRNPDATMENYLMSLLGKEGAPWNFC